MKYICPTQGLIEMISILVGLVSNLGCVVFKLLKLPFFLFDNLNIVLVVVVPYAQGLISSFVTCNNDPHKN